MRRPCTIEPVACEMADEILVTYGLVVVTYGLSAKLATSIGALGVDEVLGTPVQTAISLRDVFVPEVAAKPSGRLVP